MDPAAIFIALVAFVAAVCGDVCGASCRLDRHWTASGPNFRNAVLVSGITLYLFARPICATHSNVACGHFALRFHDSSFRASDTVAFFGIFAMAYAVRLDRLFRGKLSAGPVGLVLAR